MQETVETALDDRCGKCGSVVYPFSTRIAQSDQQKYCTKCAEEVDARYLIKNSCSVCGKLMERHEVKFVLPSLAYGRSAMPLEDRLSCPPCYTRLQRKSRSRIMSGRGAAIRERIRRQFAGQLLKKRVIDITDG
ncbi:MAG TPA: hypothetical protein VL944_02010 [Candidatus Acidoferrum sp.]|nr:hypothetical protein [Candidatus Acidoferrum sp.]